MDLQHLSFWTKVAWSSKVVLIKTMNCNAMLMKTVNREPSMISVPRPNFLCPGIPNHGSTMFGSIEFMLDIQPVPPEHSPSFSTLLCAWGKLTCLVYINLLPCTSVQLIGNISKKSESDESEPGAFIPPGSSFKILSGLVAFLN